MTVITISAAPRRQDDPAVGERQRQHRHVETMQEPHDEGLGLLTCAGRMMALSAGVTVKVASRPPASA